MNWTKQKRFVVGFVGFVALATAALGYLVVSSQARYSAALTSYQENITKLKGLESRSPFPDAKNLKVLEAQRAEIKASIADLHKALKSHQIPLEEITEVQFQDRLKEAVLRVTSKAAERAMELPPKFYMGFDPYQSQPPRPEATALLYKELKAIEIVISQLIDARVVALSEIVRDPFPEETDRSRGKPDPKAARPGTAGGAKDAGYTQHGLKIHFRTDQNGFRTALNGITTSKVQFFVPRRIEVKNDKEKGPARSESVPVFIEPVPQAPVAGEAAPAAGRPGPVAEPELKYIVGEEKIDVVMRLDIVDLAELSAK